MLILFKAHYVPQSTVRVYHLILLIYNKYEYIHSSNKYHHRLAMFWKCFHLVDTVLLGDVSLQSKAGIAI